MLTITAIGTDRLDITLDGKLDSDQMRAALDDLIRKSADIRNGKMLYRIRELRAPTLGAIGVELAKLPALLRLVRQFDKCAVVADQEWLQKLAEIEGALIPGLTIKGFDDDDEDDAERWLNA